MDHPRNIIDRTADSSAKTFCFLCECGPIIKEALDLDTITKHLQKKYPNLIIKRYGTLCSEDGQQWLEQELKEHKIDRFIIAGCSPAEHGKTFDIVCRRSHFNPYLMTMANIREQCSWVTPDRDLATLKAIRIINAALVRNIKQIPLDEIEIDYNTDVVVIGAGVAGMTAAKLLADADRKVYLIEQAPAIGGFVPLMNEVFPNMECSSCMIEPMMDDILHHPNIEVMTKANVIDILGFLGHFNVKIQKKSRYVDLDACYGCGTCHEACPISIEDKEFNAGFSTRKAIFIPYPGALPNTSLIDAKHCLTLNGEVCDACVQVCPFGSIDLSMKDEFIEKQAGAVVIATGLDRLPKSEKESPQNVVNSFAFERFLNPDGPTGGEIVTSSGRKPLSIAIIHCSETETNGPAKTCSSICCMMMAKYVKEIQKRIPDAVIHSIVYDRCCPGKGYRQFYSSTMQKADVKIIPMHPDDTYTISSAENDRVSIQIKRLTQVVPLTVDMAVVCPSLRGSRTMTALSDRMKLDRDEYDFFREEHEKLNPMQTRTSGIYIAGCAQGPKDIQTSVSHAAGTAAHIMARLIPGKKMRIEPITAEVDSESCGSCQLCVLTCPYQAITFNTERGVAEINDTLCRGCGTCAAVCPSSAITARHFTDPQIMSEIVESISD